MTRKEQVRLAAEVSVDPRTVARWDEDPDSVLDAVDYALRAGCRKLNLQPPGNPNESTG